MRSLDAVRVTVSDRVITGRTLSMPDTGVPHTDLVQIISSVPGRANQQYALAVIQGARITNNVLHGTGTVQGIFMGDGLAYDIDVSHNTITTDIHPLTLCGVISGRVVGNTLASGAVELRPARIASGCPETTVHIVGFLDPRDDYQPVEMSAGVRDLRRVPPTTGVALANFDLAGFWDAVMGMPDFDGATAGAAYAALALGYGVPVTPGHATTQESDTMYDAAIELGLSGDIPRGIRNNNPGNVEYSSSNTWMGQANPPSDGRYCRFIDPRQGIRACLLLLLNYQSRYRIKTIAGIFERYAPRQDNNATDAYIKAVADHVGVRPNQLVSVRDYKTAYKIMEAIIRVENGMQPYPDALIAEGVAMAGITMGGEVAANNSVKPVIKSTEQAAAGTIGAGSAGLGGLEWLKAQLESNQSAVVDGLEKTQAALAGLRTVEVIQTGLLVVIAVSLAYLVWKRHEASLLGLR